MRLRGLLAGLALAATSLAAGALALDRIFPPDLSRYNDRSTEIVDSNGRLLRAFTTADGKWRLKTTVDDVDPVYLALLKAYEDRRFDDHWGVDPLAAVRAAEQWISRGRIVSGASTLSMQAARLLEPDRVRAASRTKAIQSARALQLEWRYSKREVLAIYLTLAPMGGNLEGVRAASFAYFGKEPKHLNAAEAALLVAIPQSPERRRPDRSPAAAQAARERVLARGLQHDVIDASLRDLASSRPVPNRRLAMPLHAPHLSAWLAGQSPGAVVPTTIRFELQSALLQLAREERGRIADRPDIAIVAVDNRTGTVVAWQGGSRLFRPRRPGRPGARPSLARLGAEAADLRHGVRRSHAASGIADRGRAGALPRLAAAQLRPRPSGRRHRAPRAAAVAERAGRAGAGEGRAAALPVDPAHRGRRARPAAGRHRRVAGHCARQRHGLAAGDGRALCRPGARRRVRAAHDPPRPRRAAIRCA